MGTSFEEIESMAMTIIKNDMELDFSLANRRPVFFNTMAAYMKMAIPLFNRPPEVIIKLMEHTEPDFGDEEVELTASPAQRGKFAISTSLTGFDICSVGIIKEDKFGGMVYEPVPNITYHSEDGSIEIDGYYAKGTVFTVECYKGAAFAAELNSTEKEILAFCIYNVHEHRLDNDALERMLKIEDSSFKTRSESAHMQANTARQKEVDRELWGKLNAYQNNLEYMQTVMKKTY